MSFSNPFSDISASLSIGLVSNIAGSPLMSSRDHFLHHMSEWVTAIPNSTQWIILFDRIPPALNTSVLQGLERTGGDKKGWDIDNAVQILNTYGKQQVVGCIFAQGVKMPGEGVNNDYITIDNSKGYLAGLVGGARKPYSDELTIEFRETNTSFVDFVVRPWLYLAEHYGLVARPPEETFKNVKTNISVLEYTRTFSNVSMIPRKITKFHNCTPAAIDTYDLNYGEEHMQTMSTGWNFTNITIENNLYLPLPSLINGIGIDINANIGPININASAGIGF